MNNLVIGSDGFIGNSLCDYFISYGENVIRCDIKEGAQEDARYIKLGLDMNHIDRVYFLAWDVGGAKYLYNESTQLHQIEWNTQLLYNVMTQLKDTTCKLMFVSSHLSDNTNSAYGVTKKLGEMWTDLIKGINIRLWNIYGPYESPSQRSHVVGDLIHQAIQNKHIDLLTNGEEKRQFIHIDDLTYVMKLLMDTEQNGTYDITTSQWTSIFEIAEIIAKLTNSTISRGENKGSEVLINPTKLPENWSHKISLEEGLERTINEYRNSSTPSRVIANSFLCD